MKVIFKSIASESRRLAENPLFAWLRDGGVDEATRLAFVPMALDFIMGFRDFNLYYVRYPMPADAFEAALNEHSKEDETHSRLLLEDWASLGMDARLGWAPRDLYWWMTDRATAAARRDDFELMKMVWSNPDPLLRFAIIEAMEAAGNVFFRRTVPLADALERRTGRPFPYFGKYHLDRETGHLQNGDERPFLAVELDAQRRAAALDLVGRVFRIFEAHFTSWEGYARALHERRFTYSTSREARAAATMRPDSARDLTEWTRLEHPEGLTGVARELADERHTTYAALWASRGYRWVREAFPGDFRTMTRYFLLQWIVDNWACADYFELDATYPSPATPLERGINRLSAMFASEMRRRYVEWETLELDAFTGFSVTEALRHYWLDDAVAAHREAFADLRKLTFRYPKPLHRYWIMKCFVRFGDTLMRSLGEAMARAREPDEGFITFAGHPERLHPDLPPDPEADSAVENVEREPLAADDVAAIRAILAETRLQEARRAEATWRVVHERRYEDMHARWLVRRQGEHEGALFRSLRDQKDVAGLTAVEK